VSNQPSHFVTLYWELWFFLSTLTFLVQELYQLFSGHPENTLSDNIWRLEKLVPGQAIMNWTFFHFAFTAMFIVLAIWLTGHFGWGLWASGLTGSGRKA
jgi:hypothetical protein